MQPGGKVAYGGHNGGPSFSSLAFLELLKCGGTAWCIGDATMYMDKSAQSLKLGLPGGWGRNDICCVCGPCAQVQSNTRHWGPFDLSTFQAWPMAPCTPNRVFRSSKERKKSTTAHERPAGTQQPVASDAEFGQAASESDVLRKRRHPVRKCRLALKGTMYKEEGSDRDSDQGSRGEELPAVPTQRFKHTTIVDVSSSSSSSSSGTSSNSDTSSKSVITSDGEDASVINLDEAGWFDMSPGVYMLSELEEFELKD